MTPAPTRAVICMPSNREIPVEAADSFASVYGHGLIDGTVTAKIVLGDTFVDTARNYLVTHALDVPTNPTHIFWMDDDMVLPADVVARLAAHELPIVGGLYHKRFPPYEPVAYNFEMGQAGRQVGRTPDLGHDPHGLVQIDGLGLGCTLVRIEIYTAMAEHYGDAWWHQVSSGRGEDLHFFERCQGMGIDVWLDCDVRCGHVRRETVTTLHHVAYRRAHPPAPPVAE